MIRSKPLIEDVIEKRKMKNDKVKEFATRNKASPVETWQPFEAFKKESFNNIYKLNIDGIKLKFRYVTLTINGRY